MSLRNESLDILIQLGLTRRQAEVYLSICEMKQAPAKTCAKKMQIARAEVYRAVSSLEKLGLIKRIIGIPTIFRATPIAEGLSILLKQNDKKNKEIQAKTKQFTNNLKNSLEEPNKEECECALTFEVAYDTREFKKVMNKLKMSLDCIINWPRFKRDVLNCTACYKRALERGVKMRYITHLAKGGKIPQVFHILRKRGSFEVKYNSTPPPATFAILDKEETAVITSPEDCLLEQTILWSNSPNLVGLFQDYFELRWQSATAPCWHKKNHQS